MSFFIKTPSHRHKYKLKPSTCAGYIGCARYFVRAHTRTYAHIFYL